MGFDMVVILFPADREYDLHNEMLRRAKSPWLPSKTNTHGEPPDEGRYYFRREETETEPGGILCIRRRQSGHWLIDNVVTEPGVPDIESIEPEMVYRFVREFFTLIAGPAAEAVDGGAFIRFGV